MSSVPRIFKPMAERVGLPVDVVKRISGHSIRVGPRGTWSPPAAAWLPSRTQDCGTLWQWSTATA